MSEGEKGPGFPTRWHTCQHILTNHSSDEPLVSLRPAGILFFVAIFTAMSSVFGALNTFPTERNIINRSGLG